MMGKSLSPRRRKADLEISLPLISLPQIIKMQYRFFKNNNNGNNDNSNNSNNYDRAANNN